VKLLDAKKILMLGVGGTGMRNLAYLLYRRGIQMAGVDERAEEIRHWPVLDGIEVKNEAVAQDQLGEADLVIYSEALDKEHPLLAASQALKKQTMLYHEAVGELGGSYQMIAVAGTHGKSSTAAMLAH